MLARIWKWIVRGGNFKESDGWRCTYCGTLDLEHDKDCPCR